MSLKRCFILFFWRRSEWLIICICCKSLSIPLLQRLYVQTVMAASYKLLGMIREKSRYNYHSCV
jgi:hypothetical protein